MLVNFNNNKSDGRLAAKGKYAIDFNSQNELISSTSISKIVREFILSSFCDFKSLENERENVKSSRYMEDENNYNKDIMLKHSKLFRKRLTVLLYHLSHLNVLKNSHFEEYDLIQEIEKIWQLCEIFHINTTKNLSLEISKWFQECGLTLDKDESMQLLSSNNINDFNWDVIYQFILNGKIKDVWEILQVHPTIRKINNSRSNSNGSVSDNRILDYIKEILFDHPFSDFVSNGLDSLSDEELIEIDNGLLSLKFNKWQSKVRKVFDLSETSILSKIPQLENMFHILLGHVDVIHNCCNNDWMVYSLSLLLYVYPPPLTKANICRIVEDSMTKMMGSMDDLPEDERDGLINRNEAMRGVMMGDIAQILRRVYEMGSSSNGTDISLAIFLTTGHLTHILLHGGDMSDFLEPFPNAPFETSFPEEVLLEVAQKLNDYDYPIDVVLGYLLACKKEGKNVARVLLSRRYVTSDEDAIALSSILRKLGMDIEAKVVEVSRGTWWLQQSRIDGGFLNHSAGVVKALYFYQLAGDSSRSISLLDRKKIANNFYFSFISSFFSLLMIFHYIFIGTLWRCCNAVHECSSLFPNFQLNPVTIKGPSSRYADGSKDFIDMRNDNIENSITDQDKLNILRKNCEVGRDMKLTLRNPSKEVLELAEILCNYIEAIESYMRVELHQLDIIHQINEADENIMSTNEIDNDLFGVQHSNNVNVTYSRTELQNYRDSLTKCGKIICDLIVSKDPLTPMR
jgi:hypothetical protein